MVAFKNFHVPVLMMHGVCDPVPRYARMPDGRTCLLAAEDFDGLVGWCRKEFDVVRLSELDDLFGAGGTANTRPIVLTFDDGLASTLDHAVPILKKYGLSATMFVTTAWIDSGMTPPIFELERVLFRKAPTQIELSVGEHSFRRDVESTGEVGGVLSSLWTFLFKQQIAPLKLRTDDFMVGGHPLTLSEEHDRDFWFPASWNQLRSAVSDGVLEIGSHMESHTPLTWLETDRVEEEMGGSKSRLEAELGVEVESCSYPHGLSNPGIRASAGKFYRWAFSNSGGVLRHTSSHHLAPRFHVPGEHWARVKNHIRVARWDPFDLRSCLAKSIASLRARPSRSSGDQRAS